MAAISNISKAFAHLIFVDQANKQSSSIGPTAKMKSSIIEGVPSEGVNGESKPTNTSMIAVRFTIMNIIFVFFITLKHSFAYSI